VSVVVFETGALPESIVEPVDDTVALRETVSVGEPVDVFDGGSEKVPDILLRNVLVIRGVSVVVLVVRDVIVIIGDADDERDGLKETVALELPVEVFETAIDNVGVRVKIGVYDE
jgi:hypothetical protein